MKRVLVVCSVVMAFATTGAALAGGSNDSVARSARPQPGAPAQPLPGTRAPDKPAPHAQVDDSPSSHLGTTDAAGAGARAPDGAPADKPDPGQQMEI